MSPKGDAEKQKISRGTFSMLFGVYAGIVFFQNQNFSTFASFLGCSWSKHHLATGLLDLISGLHESWIVTCQFSQTLKSEQMQFSACFSMLNPVKKRRV